MSLVKIEWKIRAAGRSEGDVETVECTPFIEACIKSGRVAVLEYPEAIVGVVEPAPSVPVIKGIHRPDPVHLEAVDPGNGSDSTDDEPGTIPLIDPEDVVDDSPHDTEGTIPLNDPEPVKAAPKPRGRPRKTAAPKPSE